MSLTDEDVERFVEAEANKNTQRKMHSERSIDEVTLKSFWPRHSAARIRRLPQQISILCEKKDLVMNMSQQHSKELSLQWKWSYLKNLLLQRVYWVSKDNVRQLNCARGTGLGKFFQA